MASIADSGYTAAMPESPVAVRRVALLVMSAALLWHLLAVLAPPQSPPPPNTEGRDFASYYYAVQAAWRGYDPYDKAQLDRLSSEDGTRDSVHPFFYPPPFLGLVVWAVPLSLETGFRVWFLLNELCLLAAGLALWRWWRPLGPSIGPVLAAVIALSYSVAYGQELGQANFPVLALVLVGLWLERERPALAGVLVGLACMMKMSPALIVAWWLLRRRWTAVGASLLTAVLSSLLVMGIVSPRTQWRFYSQILPQFGSGDYNGLIIKIEMFGNHSIPNLLHQWFPSGTNRLSGTARALSGASTLGLVALLGFLFHRPTTDRLREAGQAAAVLVAMLLVPVYAYEHHLVFAIPALVLAMVAVERGELSVNWVGPLGATAAVLAFELPALKQLAVRVVTEANIAAWWGVQELKFLALLVLLAASCRLGATALLAPSRAPSPEPATGDRG